MNAISKPSDVRRDHIVAIARQVFMEEGYAAASMSAIAARVGGSKGTLYNYFRSKAELFDAVIREDCDRMQDVLFEAKGSADDLETTLLHLGRGFVRLMLSDEVLAMHRIVVAESARFPEVGEAHFRAGPKRGKERLMALFDEAIAEGQLKIADKERAAEQLAELMLAGIYRRRLFNIGPPPAEAEIDANVEAGLAVFMAAYGTGRR
jgi:AcrR family transcriptional regulator